LPAGATVNVTSTNAAASSMYGSGFLRSNKKKRQECGGTLWENSRMEMTKSTEPYLSATGNVTSTSAADTQMYCTVQD